MASVGLLACVGLLWLVLASCGLCWPPVAYVGLIWLMLASCGSCWPPVACVQL